MEGTISETLALAEVVRDPYVAECSETALLAAAGCFVPRTKAVQTSLRDLSRVCGAKRAIDPARARVAAVGMVAVVAAVRGAHVPLIFSVITA